MMDVQAIKQPRKKQNMSARERANTFKNPLRLQATKPFTFQDMIFITHPFSGKRYLYCEIELV